MERDSQSMLEIAPLRNFPPIIYLTAAVTPLCNLVFPELFQRVMPTPSQGFYLQGHIFCTIFDTPLRM